MGTCYGPHSPQDTPSYDEVVSKALAAILVHTLQSRESGFDQAESLASVGRHAIFRVLFSWKPVEQELLDKLELIHFYILFKSLCLRIHLYIEFFLLLLVEDLINDVLYCLGVSCLFGIFGRFFFVSSRSIFVWVQVGILEIDLSAVVLHSTGRRWHPDMSARWLSILNGQASSVVILCL